MPCRIGEAAASGEGGVGVQRVAVAGEPIEQRLTGAARASSTRSGAWSGLAKAVADRVCAALLLLALAPLLLGLAFAIRSGGGKALHRETRVGRGGVPFTLLRFRSTVSDPEARVTTVGAWMRRYALAELTCEENARLDLRYVQHWSLIQDALILGRAVGAIRRSEQI
jgi:lipopolysaccharide/colanic/teichoic acid biosynthesis glycosyltransferase